MGVPSKFSLAGVVITLILFNHLFTIPILSQTVIKEKITINPTSIHKNIQKTNSDWYFEFGDLSNGSPVIGISCFQPEGVDNYYRLTIEDSTEIQFCYGYWEQELLGGTLKVSGSLFRWGWYWGIILLTDHCRTDTQKVTVKIESIDRGNENITYETKFYQIKIFPDSYYFYRLTSDSKFTVALGKKVSTEVLISPGVNASPFGSIPEELKLNLEIIKGDYLSEIEISEENLKGDIIRNVDHHESRLQFTFSANGNLNFDTDTAIIRVSSDYPNMDEPNYKDFIFIVMRYEPIQVTFFPNTMEPGDTVNVILKKRNNDGSLTDFCEDQWFDIEIIDGKDYSTFYIPEWNYETDQEYFVHQGFKLILTDPISEGSDYPTILVMTSGYMIGSQLPYDDNGSREKLNKITKSISSIRALEKNVKMDLSLQKKAENKISKDIAMNKLVEGDCILWLDNVQLFGTGTIGTTETERAYIKAYFEKPELMPGDTSEIIIKMVDEAGNESDYPPGTLFETGIKEGCESGNILTSSGETGKFFSSISSPIRFIVADSLSQDSIVVLRVGVSDADLVQSSVNKSTQNINRTIIKESSNTTTVKDNLKYVLEDTYCAVGNYIYENKDFPSAVVEDIIFTMEIANHILLPLNDSENVPNPNYNPNGPDKRKNIIDFSKTKKTAIKIKIFDSAHKAKSNTRFKINTSYKKYSGGHDHDAGRPLSKIKDENGNIGTELYLITNSIGECNVTFISNGFAGFDTVSIIYNNKRILLDSVITKRIDLIRMEEGIEINPNKKYALIGETSSHQKNHFCLASTANKLKMLADSMFINYGRILQFNDMSLIWGGPFDCDSAFPWNTPHLTHRDGRNVDLRIYSIDGRVINYKVLKNFFKNVFNGNSILLEGNPAHYHINF